MSRIDERIFIYVCESELDEKQSRTAEDFFDVFKTVCYSYNERENRKVSLYTRHIDSVVALKQAMETLKCTEDHIECSDRKAGMDRVLGKITNMLNEMYQFSSQYSSREIDEIIKYLDECMDQKIMFLFVHSNNMDEIKNLEEKYGIDGIIQFKHLNFVSDENIPRYDIVTWKDIIKIPKMIVQTKVAQYTAEHQGSVTFTIVDGKVKAAKWEIEEL